MKLSLVLPLALGLCFALACGDDSRPGSDAARSDTSVDASDVDAPDAPGSDVGADQGVPPGALRVFVTSSGSGGNLGGLSGADARCQSIAERAGLSGTWIAWLSLPGFNAIDRLSGAGPWFNLEGQQVFATRDAVSDPFADLEAGIWYDETGSFSSSDRIWTGTSSNGEYVDSIGDNCQAWTSDAMGDQARIGQVGRQGTEWTAFAFTTCDQTGTRLICFEQG